MPKNVVKRRNVGGIATVSAVAAAARLVQKAWRNSKVSSARATKSKFTRSHTRTKTKRR